MQDRWDHSLLLLLYRSHPRQAKDRRYYFLVTSKSQAITSRYQEAVSDGKQDRREKKNVPARQLGSNLDLAKPNILLPLCTNPRTLNWINDSAQTLITFNGTSCAICCRTPLQGKVTSIQDISQWNGIGSQCGHDV